MERTATDVLVQPEDGAAEFFFPRRCAFCGRYDRRLLCEACAETAQALAWKPGTDPRFGSVWLPEVVGLWKYTGAPRDALLRAKYQEKDYPLYAMAEGLLAEADARQLPRPELIVSVPPHRRAISPHSGVVPAALADLLGIRCHVPVASRLLYRAAESVPQHLRSRRERAGGEAGVYAVRRTAPLQGKTVWLVDDVMTTGATMNACARVLWLYGAARVIGLCPCISPQGALPPSDAEASDFSEQKEGSQYDGTA